MPYSRNSSSYPSELFRLVDQVADGAVATKVFDNAKQARGQRARWYQFVSALKRDANNPPKWMDQREALDRVRKALAIECYLEGNTLIFRARDTAPSSQAWADMKITYPESKAPADLTKSEQETLNELMGKLKGEKK